MSSQRPTVRPVSLTRLVEIASISATEEVSTLDIKSSLGVSQKRAREAILESKRLGLISPMDGREELYVTTSAGEEFVSKVKLEDWGGASKILKSKSPHYRSFLKIVDKYGPLKPATALDYLTKHSENSQYQFNNTSLDILSDWSLRFGIIQRNVFTGTLYSVDQSSVPVDFHLQISATIEELEESVGVNLRQRYISIPELRERFCEQIGCSREAFDDGFIDLAKQNIGKLELSGAPIDSGAKEARFGIKRIAYGENENLITADQTSDQVMTGIKMNNKQFYYVTVHDQNLQFEEQ